MSAVCFPSEVHQNKNTVFTHRFLVRAVREGRTAVTGRWWFKSLFWYWGLNDETVSGKEKKNDIRNQVMIAATQTCLLEVCVPALHLCPDIKITELNIMFVCWGGLKPGRWPCFLLCSISDGEEDEQHRQAKNCWSLRPPPKMKRKRMQRKTR